MAQSRRRPAPARTHAPAPVVASAAPAAPVAPVASAAPAALAASVATVADRLRLSPLVAAGLAVLLVGGLGDVIVHAAPPALAAVLAPLVGPAGERAHLLTFAGMLVASVGLIGRGLRRA